MKTNIMPFCFSSKCVHMLKELKKDLKKNTHFEDLQECILYSRGIWISGFCKTQINVDPGGQSQNLFDVQLNYHSCG